MKTDDPRLAALLAKISDGDRVDWDEEAKQWSAEEERALIRSLRLVAIVAEGHRDAAVLETPQSTASLERAPVIAPPRPEPAAESPSPPVRHVPAASLPGFRIVRKLGEGGMGIVYEAEQSHPRRPVALKVIRAGHHADPLTLRMFEREMQTLARLKHPGIAAIYESGTTPEGLPFYTMELVRGETLGAHLERREPATSKDRSASQVRHDGADELAYRLALFRKICEAVAYAHQRGIIHRDLKPSNILVLREPPSAPSSGPTVPDIKILDFGLARIADPDASGTLVSEIGGVKGTLAYISPEQVRGNPDEIDLRTDVYSLGVILYEALTGKLPYDLPRGSLPEAVRVICEEAPRPIAQSLSGGRRLDADVATIVGKALEKESSRRYSSAQSLAEDVQRYLTNQPIQARRPSAAYQFRKLVARHKLVFAFAAVLFVVLTASTIGLAVQAARIARERDRASQQAETADRVSEFLMSLFRVSDPGESRGNTVTAREILDAGSERISRELKDQPIVRARMLDTMGNVYRSLGLFGRAEPLLQEGLRVREQTLGPDHPDTALSHNSLAQSLTMHGADAEGQRQAERSLEILKASGQAKSVAAAWALYFLANSRANQGDFAGANEKFESARLLFEKHLGHESLPVAWCLGDLGRSLAMAGDLHGALAPSEEALQIKERVLGAKHPDVATSLNNVGYLRMHLGEPGPARQNLERALAIAEATYGPDHRATANVLESLGELSLQSGELPAARIYLERTLAILQKQVDPAAYDTALAQLFLARVLVAQGDLDRAGVLFETTLAANELTGSLGSEAVTLYAAYADYLRHRGRTAEAATFDRRAREAKGKTVGAK